MFVNFVKNLPNTWWGILIMVLFCCLIWIVLSIVFYKHIFKRIYDILFSVVAFPFFILILIPVAIAIKCEDKGSIFYCGERIGKNGKTFKMIKFRSMQVNAPDVRLMDGSTYNGEDDPRVTKVGRFLRKTSLDEIAQVINVFLGQMSVLGPRPDPVDWLDKYTLEQKVFLKVRPGVSGYNQAYYRNSANGEQKIENDVFYAKHLSFWLDLKIIFKTACAILKHENVYIDEQRLDNKSELQDKEEK